MRLADFALKALCEWTEWLELSRAIHTRVWHAATVDDMPPSRGPRCVIFTLGRTSALFSFSRIDSRNYRLSSTAVDVVLLHAWVPFYHSMQMILVVVMHFWTLLFWSARDKSFSWGAQCFPELHEVLPALGPAK